MSYSPNLSLCKCGCGNKVKNESSIYLQGHHVRGRIVSEETRRKVSKSNKGQIPWTAGKELPIQTKQRISNALKGKKLSLEHRTIISKALIGNQNNLGTKLTEETKSRLRKERIKQISTQKFNGEPIMPSVGFQERLCLDCLEQFTSFHIIRQKEIYGYFLDGYIKELNIAVEFDENHHNKVKDDIRQKNIVNQLGCNFFRVTDKMWLTDKDSIINKFKELVNE